MSLALFASNLAGMTVTGVVRKYNAPPEQINHADLPCSYPRLPEAERETVTFTALTGLRGMAIELVVVVEAVSQNLSDVNFVAAVALLDALETALAANAMAYEVDRWSTRVEADVIGDTPYWLLVCRVEGSE